MTEIRLRPKQVIFIIALFCIILFLVSSSSKCSTINTSVSVPVDYFRQLMKQKDTNLPTIYVITPTYYRPVQKAELTRLSHLFMLLPNLFWILIEDSNESSNLVKNLLKTAGLENRSTLLAIKTPDQFKLKGNDPNWKKARGVEQRNKGLEWIRKNTDKDLHSIVYFMDDDNTYSIELFNEMIKIEPGRVGIWPVGLVGGLMVEKPILDPNTKKVISFNAAWRPERPFPIDMASFAISSELLFQRPEAQFSYEVERGYQESEILRHLITIDQLQPLADLCTKVYVWHTRTEKPKLTEEEKLIKNGKKPSNDGIEV